MQVPLSAVRAWLHEEAEVAVADVEGVPKADAGGGERGRLVLRWRGADDSTVVPARALRPGDTVVVPAGYGGISNGNWDPGSRSKVTDLGDRAQLSRGRLVTLRIHPDVLPEGVPSLEVTPETEADDLRDRLEKWLRTVAQGDEGDLPKWFQDAATALVGPLRSRLRHRWAPRGDNAYYLVLSARAGRAWRRQVSVDDLDGSDLTNSFTGTDEPVVLWDHLRGVGELAAEFARRCGVPDPVAADLRLAGQLHDLGKADPRFQRWLHGGDEIRALAADDLIAKSAGDAQDPVARRRARQASRYPEGARHELVSVALVQEVPEVAARGNDWNLVLHLVASHHGNCRPLAPVVRDPNPEDVPVDLGRLWEDSGLSVKASTDHGLERIGSGVTDRFWRLVRAYGWWGLAWLEALFRLADHVQSQREREAREAASND